VGKVWKTDSRLLTVKKKGRLLLIYQYLSMPSNEHCDYRQRMWATIPGTIYELSNYGAALRQRGRY
jgi:hypothetical protein